jgi:exodeoxyribonuclease V alpha subunit
MNEKQRNKRQTQQLVGTVERITFHHPETGFCVLRITPACKKNHVVLTGTIARIYQGALLEAKGEWFVHKKHGRQFNATNIRVLPPTHVEGVKKYLSSGLIKGIGQHFATKLVDAFGVAVFDVVEHHPERLSTLPGIGKKRLQQIVHAFHQQKEISQVMVFLQSYGIGTARAIRIYKTYKAQTIEQIKANPYQLIYDIYGIGFKLADDVAQNLGIEKGALIRVRAGVYYLVQELTQKGHCAVEYTQLIQQAKKLLSVQTSLIVQAIQAETREKKLIEDKIDQQRCIFTVGLHQAELDIAKQLKRLQRGQPPWLRLDIAKALLWVESLMTFKLSLSQRDAIEMVFKNKLSIITGGPGVGKTTITASIVKILQAKGMRIMLCAPTGRAAKRLSEATQKPAKTIHRLLEYIAQKRQFKYNAYNTLPVDFLIVDEASMLDASLMYYLIRALPITAACVLIGDINQLPSVGPGAVLKNLIESQCIATAFLTKIFRQAEASHIVLNAHRVNHGIMPENIPSTSDQLSDFYMLHLDEAADIQAKIVELIKYRIPRRFGLNPITDIQVLTPMHRSSLGSFVLNDLLQKALNNHKGPKVQSHDHTFMIGDKVIQQVNNYDKEVFNGDLGVIRTIDSDTEKVYIQFENRLIPYELSQLHEVNLAYAMSIHKSQGSEYPAVIIPMVTQHYIMLARNLLYTAITRGKKLVILIGHAKAIKIAVGNTQIKARLTKLKEWMIE